MSTKNYMHISALFEMTERANKAEARVVELEGKLSKFATHTTLEDPEKEGHYYLYTCLDEWERCYWNPLFKDHSGGGWWSGGSQITGTHWRLTFESPKG